MVITLHPGFSNPTQNRSATCVFPRTGRRLVVERVVVEGVGRGFGVEEGVEAANVVLTVLTLYIT